MGRRARIESTLQRFGTQVTVKYLPVLEAVPVGEDDWPDPDAAPQVPPPPDTIVKVFAWSGLSGEVNSQFRSRESVSNVSNVREEGILPTEYATMVFPAGFNLNEVDWVLWQGSRYRILYSDLYEFAGEKLAQQAVMMRATADNLLPHA